MSKPNEDQIAPGVNDPERPVPRRYRLGTQVFLGFLVLAVIIALVAGLAMRNMEDDYLTSSAMQDHNSKFDLLRSSLIENVISEDLPQLETILERLIKNETDLAAIEVTNEAGLQMFYWRRATPPAHDHWLGSGEHEMQRLSGDFVFAGEKFGTISAAWSMARVKDEAIRHGTTLFFVILVVCVGLSLLAYLFITILAVAPIDRICQRLIAFRQGDFSPAGKPPLIVSAELQRLDDSVDTLATFLIGREHRERELSEAKDAAESANRAKSTFLAMMSHELRTPLNAINGFSEILDSGLHGPLGDGRYKGYAQEIHSSGEHLLELINDILDISKIEAGKFELVIDKFDLAQMVSTAIRIALEPNVLGDIEIVIDIADDLPAISADERRLRQVMINLISNAVKFSPKGSRITIAAEWCQERGLAIAVTDTGIGIASEDLERVLEPFSQIENVYSRHHEGTGLGLALCKALVQLHGGKLELRSTLGEGTTVYLRFPPTLCAEAPGATETRSGPVPAPAMTA